MLYGPLLTAGALNDVTTRDNGAYTAGGGWDACTGLGSPNGTAILLRYHAARQVAPAVTQLSESSGNPGDRLVVTGTGFLGATAVGFGAVAAGFGQPPPDDGTIDSDTQVTVTMPSGPASGTTVDVTVTAPGGASQDTQADQFTYRGLGRERDRGVQASQARTVSAVTHLTHTARQVRRDVATSPRCAAPDFIQ